MPGELVRVVIAGSGADGKSTLIDRLLAQAEVDADAVRRLVLTDAAEYTRDIVSEASTADVALVMVDAATGVIEQTKRLVALIAALRVQHVVLTVNKMDLVDYREEVFDEIVADFAAAADRIGLREFTPIPVAALIGENVIESSTRMSWYGGLSLCQHLDDISLVATTGVPARLAVQVVIRPHLAAYPDYRGYAGRVDGGLLEVGQQVVVLPRGNTSIVVGIDTADGELSSAAPGRSVTVRLADDIDISRGDLIVADLDPRPSTVRELTATLCWLSADPLRPGARLGLRHTTRQVRAIVGAVVSRFDLATLSSVEASELSLDDIGTVQLRTSEPIVVDPYALNRSTGAFLLVDEASGITRAAGMVAAS